MKDCDVSDWAVIRDEPGGRDPNKRWLAEHPDAPRHTHWLWKSRQVTGDGTEYALTDYSEVVTSRLARVLGIPAAQCEFAVCDGELGLVSRNVTPGGFSMNTGASYLPEVPGYQRLSSSPAKPGVAVGMMRRDRGYTLAAVEQVLGNVQAPPGTTERPAFEVFAGYLVLDALVGNSDRHPGNWALLESHSDGDRFLAPSYDHGSALGAGLTEANRRAKDPIAFARRGKANPFQPDQPALVDLALLAVERSQTPEWIDRVEGLDTVALRTALDAPGQRVSEVASRFVEQVVLENRRRLCHDNPAKN